MDRQGVLEDRKGTVMGDEEQNQDDEVTLPPELPDDADLPANAPIQDEEQGE
jgi:hypothetical protein